MDKRLIVLGLIALWWFYPRSFNAGLPPNTLTLYWGSFCPHCLSFKPIFDEVSASNQSKIALRSVESSENNEYQTKYVPTLVYTDENGQSQELNIRSKEGLVQFLSSH